MEMPDNIIVGKPIFLEGESENVKWEDLFDVLGILPEEKTVFTDERHLPRILSDHGFFKSASAVRKAVPKKGQPPFLRDLDTPEFSQLKIGRHRLTLIIGE